jgi:hypothetical protein
MHVSQTDFPFETAIFAAGKTLRRVLIDDYGAIETFDRTGKVTPWMVPRS